MKKLLLVPCFAFALSSSFVFANDAAATATTKVAAPAEAKKHEDKGDHPCKVFRDACRKAGIHGANKIHECVTVLLGETPKSKVSPAEEKKIKSITTAFDPAAATACKAKREHHGK